VAKKGSLTGGGEKKGGERREKKLWTASRGSKFRRTKEKKQNEGGIPNKGTQA